MWESTSNYLRVGKGDKDAPAERDPFDVVAGTGIVWSLPGSLGREYAAVSGDHNPIHLYPLSAKAFGFKRQIAHGMWSKARCVAAFANRLGDEATVEVEFKKPIFLPGKVAFGSRVVDDGAHRGLDFSLTNPGSGAPHLVGRARTRAAEPRLVHADQALLRDARHEPAVPAEHAGDGQPATARGRRRDLVVEPPLVGPERPVEPDRVVQRRGLHPG